MSLDQTRFKKFSRDPGYLSRYPGKRLTKTSLEILAVIERYRLIPTSLLVRLINANDRVVYRHLQYLYHARLINRFALFGRTGRAGEFNYFLDNPRSLDLLAGESGCDPESLDYEGVRRMREKWKPLANEVHTAAGSASIEDASEAQRFFVKHELMITRLHAVLELACRKSGGNLALIGWAQGAKLYRYVEAPRLKKESSEFAHSGDTEMIPHRPDAFFGIQNLETGEARYFFYEAERGTNSTTRVIRKLRGHFQYVVIKKQHRLDYGIDRIRAVLIETLTTSWAERLRVAAASEMVSGPKPSSLFWFTSSEFLTRPVPKIASGRSRHVPLFLESPEVILKPLWFSPANMPGDRPYSLLS